ncbi:sulfatase-like hydrolase/transferase [Salegentibacter sp. BDJ18]|uniref:sulfatase-like hydrolase/transferase n=1 Tax=Salegentibacter sp. BDJ18 TaxID=2816376 RepID=UPI001AAEA643|nr:sulfatase-like hydrolase/transferase [Salegentibacter sp. BDJ18]MBO2543586.1 sulfatase-like hydrolase/transferase [Salegentibacter sp. BDJ18]
MIFKIAHIILIIILFNATKSFCQNKLQPEGKKKPNIIFILTDDLGYGDLGVTFQNQRAKEGFPYFRTPNIDRLAGEGMLLTRHYAPAPVCAPSRASLLLGVHQGHANVRNNQFDKALSDNPTLSSVMKQTGYATALVGKWGLQGLEGDSPESWEAYPTKRGFDHFFGYVRHRDGHNHYPAHKVRERPPMELYHGNIEISDQLEGSYTTDLFTAAAKKWIMNQEQNKPEQPFFLYLAYDTPHAGLQVAPSPYPEGGGLEGGVQWIGEPGHFINTAEESIDDYFHPDYAAKDWPVQQKRHASMVRRIDNAVGDIMKLLEDLNITDETLIVFTSDNGPHKESYGYGDYDPTFFDSYGVLDGIKRDTWEGGIRMPTIVKWSNHIPAGKRNDTPSAFYDWMPTFAELAGIPAPARTDGHSLLPILTRSGNREAGVVYIEYQQDGYTPAYSDFYSSHQSEFRGEMQVIYLDGYKGIRYDIKSAKDKFRIYDTRIDSGETNDLAENSEYFEKLQQRMQDRVLRIRRPNSTAMRPYDDVPMPALASSYGANPGLRYRVFEVATPWTPDINTIKESPVKMGTSKGIHLEVTSPVDLVIEYSGLIEVPQTGEYSFTLQTDRGALLRIHEATVIDAGKGYRSGSDISSKIYLEKGFHPIQVIYARGKKGASSLELHWSGPGFSQKLLNSEQLFH